MFRFFQSYRNNQPEDVIVHVEHFHKEEGVVIVDFFDSNDYNLFNEYAGIYFSFYDQICPSVIVITNYQDRRIQENTFYAISKQKIEEWREQEVIQIVEDSFVIGYRIELPEPQQFPEIIEDEEEESKEENDLEKIKRIFYKSVSPNELGPISSWGFLPKKINEQPIQLSGKISVTIRKTGQGNWNEIYIDNVPIYIYDIGTNLYATKKEVRYLIDERIGNYKQAAPILIISHWDLDHYHLLKGMTKEELDVFSAIIMRSNGHTLTSRVVCGMLNKDKVVELKPEFTHSKKNFLKPLTSLSGHINLYNATFHKNKNISGIVLTVRNQTSSIVLSGDCHYQQISDYILPNLNYIHKHTLVVPHHGGKAGKCKYDCPVYMLPHEAIISVGKNSYGHPVENNLRFLEKKGFKIRRTDRESKDIIIEL